MKHKNMRERGEWVYTRCPKLKGAKKSPQTIVNFFVFPQKYLNFYDFVKSCIPNGWNFFYHPFLVHLNFVLHLFPLTSSIHMDAFYFTLDFLFRGQWKHGILVQLSKRKFNRESCPKLKRIKLSTMAIFPFLYQISFLFFLIERFSFKSPRYTY
jgi:hypothetical protein